MLPSFFHIKKQKILKYLLAQKTCHLQILLFILKKKKLEKLLQKTDQANLRVQYRDTCGINSDYNGEDTGKV